MTPKSKTPLGSFSATKSIGKILTFYSRSGSQKVRYYGRPSSGASEAQAAQRLLIKTKVEAWQALSDGDKTSWNEQAAVLGDPWSGYTLFMSAWEGIMEFTELSDTFASYIGLGGKYVRVNLAETALEALEVGKDDLILQFLDNFDDESRHWAWNDQLGVGAISETSSYLEFKLTAAQDGNWWGAGIVNNPRAFIGDLKCPVEVETKLIYNTLNLSSQGGLFVSDDPLNGGNSGYAFFQQDDKKVGVAKLGTGNAFITAGPIDLPIWMRIRMIGNEKGNRTSFYYSTDGISWTNLGSVEDLPHRAVGLFCKNWGEPGPEIISRFEYFMVKSSPGPG